MKWVQIVDSNKREAWVNVDNVTHLRDYKTHRTIYFVGGGKDHLVTKESADDVASRLR